MQSEQDTKLYRTYLKEPGTAVSRPRGKSPQQAAFFTRSPRLKDESSLLANLCCSLGALSRNPSQLNRQGMLTVERGERICQAFEIYREVVAEPHISFEHLVFLIFALTKGDELTQAACEECGAFAVVDRMALDIRRCSHCDGRVGTP